jgi:hypothetical protein
MTELTTVQAVDLLGPGEQLGREAVMDRADVIVAAGPVFNDYTTAGRTGEPPAGK